MSFLTANPLIPEQAPQWNYAVIKGVKTPGVVRVSECPRKFKVDKKNVAGAQGWTNTYQGWLAGDSIKMSFEFWTADQITFFFANIFPIVYIDATKAPPTAGIDVDYPSLAANQITKLFPVQVGDLKKLSPDGLWGIEIEFVEWRVAGDKNLTSTPSGKSASGTPGQQQADPYPDDDAALLNDVTAGAAKFNASRKSPAATSRLTGVTPQQRPGFIGPPPPPSP
jgi:hypothetical protein